MLKSFSSSRSQVVNPKSRSSAPTPRWEIAMMDVVTSPRLPNFISKSRCQTRKEHRKLVKREKRRKKRQEAAKAREEEETNEPDLTPNSQQLNEEREKQLEYLKEQERKRQHELWLERERQAQEEFKRKQEKEEMLKKKEEEERKRIQAEWEEQQKKEQEKLKKEKAKKDEKQQQLEYNAIGRSLLHHVITVDTVGVLQYLDKDKKNGEELWRNPDAPAPPPDSRKSEICSFFVKTGVCRFGQRCSRTHPDPGVTRTVLLKGMYSNFAMEQSFRDEYDTDISLEYDQETAYQDFLEFYSDVLPEFERIGKVLILKVCCNWEQHLRGNVYVQFEREEDSCKALEVFNGRYYAGRSLSCEYVAVDNWRAAICGLFPFGKCPKGKNCNYLHTFANPDSRVSPAIRSHRRSESVSYQRNMRKDRWHRRREFSARSSRDRQDSRRRWWSPSKSRSRSRRNSRERIRSRSRSRSRSRGRSYSRSRSRSPCRYTSKRRGRSYSKSRSRSRSRSRSKERTYPDGSSPSKERSRSGSKSRERGRSRGHDHHENGKMLKERSSKSEYRKRTRRQSHSKRKSMSPKEESTKRRRSKRKKTLEKSKKDLKSETIEVELCDDDVKDRGGVKEMGSLGSDSSDGHEAEVEDSDSSAEENAKLDIVEKEIARLKKRAAEKGVVSQSEEKGEG